MGNTDSKTNTYGSLFKWAFLIFLFLLSFGMADDSYHIYFSLASVLLGALYLLIGEAKMEKSFLRKYLIYLIPTVVLIVLTSLSNFWLKMYSSTSTFYLYGAMNIVGGVTMVLLGIQLRNDGLLSFKEISYAIFGGLALVTLISLIASLAAYGPFYPILQSGKKYIYDSVDYSISQETIWLINFSFKEVDIRYSSVYGVTLASSLLLLLWTKFKEDRTSFLIYLVTGLVGLSHLLLVTNKWAIICYALIVVVALVIRFINFPKKTPLWEKIVGICGVSIVAIILIFMFVVAIIATNIYGTGILARIFNNGLTQPINHVINMTFKNGRAFSIIEMLFGMDPASYSFWMSDLSTDITGLNLKTVEFYALMEGGILAFLGFCVMIVFVVIATRKYLHYEEKRSVAPIAICLFLLGYLLTMSICGAKPFPYSRTEIYHSPFRDSSMFYLVLFLYGYIGGNFLSKKEKEATAI